MGRGSGSTNDGLREKKQAVAAASPLAPQTVRACLPQAKGDVLDASPAGAAPLRPRSSSPCSSAHVLARKQAGKKKVRKGEE